MMKTLIGILAAGLGVILFSSQLPLVPAAEDRQTPPQEGTQLIASLDGPALYKAYCAVCHGLDGRGGGPMAASLKAVPSDLTRIAIRNGGVYPAARVERVVSGEETIPGGHGTRAMPVWGPIFSQIAWDQDLGRLRIHNVTDYLKRIQTQ
jgi:mono/diheme cytochrome c family protein